MPDIVLLTFNARFHHASFGLRYLHANLGDLKPQCQIVEFDLDKRPADAVEQILALDPRIVGMGVYIWNTRQTMEFARIFKAIRPELPLIVGGPEISFELDSQPLADLADHVICGEADLGFPDLCRAILSGQTAPRILRPAPPELDLVAMPYDRYTPDDLRHRTLYVESSRGCPFHCEFCLSALDIPVRRFPLDSFLHQMQHLLDRGGRQFKFVDRTFNVNTDHACAILQFFLDRLVAGLFLHFEMIPDHLPEPVAQLLAKFPPGVLQLEIGIQSFDELVAGRIGRRQDNARVEENLRFLRNHTNAHIHADLIAGLPGESIGSFGAGFDRLLSLDPHEIQLGVLKRLRGALIDRHTQDFQMVYSADAPYEILQNNLLNFPTLQRIKRMARYWDLYFNSGNFGQSIRLLLNYGSAFAGFLAFADFIYAQTGKTHQLSLPRQFELLHAYLLQIGIAAEVAGPQLAADYQRPGRKDLPTILEPFARPAESTNPRTLSPRRQARHLDNS